MVLLPRVFVAAVVAVLSVGVFSSAGWGAGLRQTGAGGGGGGFFVGAGGGGWWL